jgi:hypothetical protein
MGLLDSISSTARRAQLGAEIKLVERERTQRIQALGVELYDVTRKHQVVTLPNVQRALKTPLDACTTDVRKMEAEVAEQKNDRELIEVRPDKDKGSIGRRVGDQASITKIATRIAFLEREMRLRKQKFGVQIWDVVSQPQWLRPSSDSSLSEQELEVEACVNKAKDDIRLIDDKKQGKLDQIAALQKAPGAAAK